MNQFSSIKFKKELAKSKKLDIKTIDMIVESQFQFVAQVIKSGEIITPDLKTIKLPAFGRFTYTMAKVDKINKMKALHRKSIDGITDNQQRKTGD